MKRCTQFKVDLNNMIDNTYVKKLEDYMCTSKIT